MQAPQAFLQGPTSIYYRAVSTHAIIHAIHGARTSTQFTREGRVTHLPSLGRELRDDRRLERRLRSVLNCLLVEACLGLHVETRTHT